MEDYLRNSGTRPSEGIDTYKESRASIRTTRFEPVGDGLYRKIEQVPTKTITVPL